MVTISRAEYECLKAERDELNQKLDWLLEQAHLSRKKLCGAFSERLGEELMNRLRRMFDETEPCQHLHAKASGGGIVEKVTLSSLRNSAIAFTAYPSFP